MKNCCNPVYNDIDGLTVREPEVEALVAAYFQLGRADFTDTDGRVYRFGSPEGDGAFYGWEIDPKTGEPLAEGTLLFTLHPERHGFERLLLPGLSETEAADLSARSVRIEKKKKPGFFRRLFAGKKDSGPPEGFVRLFCFKKDGIYYLTYGAPSSVSPSLSSGAYVSRAPLGPYHYQLNNPFAQTSSGLLKGAGAGVLLNDGEGRLYLAARHVSGDGSLLSGALSIYPADTDEDGTLYTLHSFPDHPFLMPARGELRASDERTEDLKPYTALLSWKKAFHASSAASGHEADAAGDEDPRTYFRPKTGGTQWLQTDLMESASLSGIQLIFHPEAEGKKREGVPYLIEGSVDGDNWFVIADHSTEKMPSVNYIPLANVRARYVILILPLKDNRKAPGVTAFRIFGKKAGHSPEAASLVRARMTDGMSAEVGWRHDSRATGHVVLSGISPSKLYLSRTVYGADSVLLTELNKNQHYYLRVDSFNECGITKGAVLKLK